MIPRSAASLQSLNCPLSLAIVPQNCHTNSMTKFNDPCTLALETDEVLMQIHNPYVANLVEMGYDRADCEMVAAAGRDATYPRTIYGRTFDTKAEYDEAVADYIAGL